MYCPCAIQFPGKRSERGHTRGRRQSGILLIEVSIAMGLAVFVAMMVMKGSLLALSSNQWTVMQSLSDAYLTRESALSNRIPMEDLLKSGSAWPDEAADDPSSSIQTVTLGRLAGGQIVQGQLTRFRTNATPSTNENSNISVWRLHSVLTYSVGNNQYVKSRSTIRSV